MQRDGLGGRGNPLAPYIALAGIWLLALTVVPPRADFPLNDDCFYAKVVMHLVETGEYQPTPYADPTFIAQAYWGAAFAKVFGFSFDTLRASTLVLALVALWAAHWAAREAGLNARWSLLIALALLANPLFLNLSYTFMTDVPFLALGTLASAAFLRAFRTQRARWVAVAAALCICGYFVRQFALIAALAAAPVLLLYLRHSTTQSRVAHALAVMLPLIAGITLYAFLPTGGLAVSTPWDWTRLGDTYSDRTIEIFHRIAIAFVYLALFAAPVLFSAPVQGGQREDSHVEGNDFSRSPKQSRFIDRPEFRLGLHLGLILLIVWLTTTTWPHRLPKLGNVLYDLGVGPILLPGMLDGLDIAAPLRLGRAWWLITIPAICGAAFLIRLHLRAALGALTPLAASDAGRRAEVFLALWSMGTIVVSTLPPVVTRFDRHFLIVQVPLSILAARSLAARRARPGRLGYAAALAGVVFGLVCLQDYLAWNSARWRAIRDLQAVHGAPIEDINGGYEFSGWYHSDRFVEESRRTGKKVFGPRGWWITEENYRVSLRPDRHFEVIGREPYFTWLGFTRREILLLKRTTPEPLP